ncbi:MAG TPA: hypothetical protein VEB40_12895 [Flavipsychrobacter sp.]|nr:hypothetical protein [Flavipsychrobacter sp.]
MSEQESIKREYDNLEASLKEAKELLAQFPDDWTLSTHISRAEHRLQALQSMQVQWNTQPNASVPQ